jgi:hypothetical protein
VAAETWVGVGGRRIAGWLGTDGVDAPGAGSWCSAEAVGPGAGGFVGPGVGGFVGPGVGGFVGPCVGGRDGPDGLDIDGLDVDGLDGAGLTGNAAAGAPALVPAGRGTCEWSSIGTPAGGCWVTTGGRIGRTYGGYVAGATSTGADTATPTRGDAGARAPSGAVGHRSWLGVSPAAAAKATPPPARPIAATSWTTASRRAVVPTRDGAPIGAAVLSPAARNAASAACSPASSAGLRRDAASTSAATTRTSASQRAASDAHCGSRRLSSASAVARSSAGCRHGNLIS